ncbi:MAG: glycosyltransferase [Candidatus Daviesbacteria bacterium]|nr:glycosyltransferase [Candidatus Daviesbacteria bacterium]
MKDLSILIPARNEMFIGRTVEDILSNIEADTEVIVVLDGKWSEPPIPQNDRVNVIYVPESIGQRAATNIAFKSSKGKYVMKLDAHCALDKGFDRKMIEAFKIAGDNVTMVPVMRNLWAFDWKCFYCGWKKYQGPTPAKCEQCGKSDNIRRKIIWVGKQNPQSKSYCFDSEPHFQYFNDYTRRPEYLKDLAETGLTETMSLQGSCWMLTREKYEQLNISDENFGSWGSQGIEVAVKTWLSGGRVLVNHATWYAHMFRTQGGDFGFPYPISGKDQEQAKAYAKELFFNDKWDKQIHPLSWLLEKFWPVRGWTEEDLAKLKANTFKFKESAPAVNTAEVEPAPTQSEPAAEPEKVIRNLEKTPDVSQGMNRGKKTAFLRDENPGRESGEAVIEAGQIELPVEMPIQMQEAVVYASDMPTTKKRGRPLKLKDVSVIGYGWVGKSVHKLFPDAYIYDVSRGDKKRANESEVAFICVPTPSLDEGQLDMSIVEECVAWCQSPLIVIRSTVNPGTCDYLSKKYNKRILMQPEYLGETTQHPLFDEKNTPFIIIGGNPQDRRILIDLYSKVYNANIGIRQVSSYEAEVIKLTENRAISFKVAECQELYDVCEKAGIDYYTIRDAVYGDDPRFNLWWTFVFPEKRGFKSKCIPKDVYAWCAWAESLGYKPEITRNLLEVNKKWIFPEPAQHVQSKDLKSVSSQDPLHSELVRKQDPLITDHEIPEEDEETGETAQQEIVGFALKDLQGVTNGKTS